MYPGTSVAGQPPAFYIRRYNQKAHTYKAYIYQIHKHAVEKGYLSYIGDSSVYLSKTKMPLSFNRASLTYGEEYGYIVIDKIKLKRPGVVVRNIIIGAAAGAILGAIIGHASGDVGSYGGITETGAAAILCAVSGAAVGAIVSSIASKKKFFIHGEWESLEEMKENLRHH